MLRHVKNNIAILLLLLIFFIGGGAVGYFILPRNPQNIEIRSTGKIITNNRIKYKTITAKVPECQEYIDKYNYLLLLYKQYLNCPPQNVRAENEKIRFEIWNIDVTNTYQLDYRAPPQRIEIAVGVEYNFKRAIGAAVNVRYADFCIKAGYEDGAEIGLYYTVLKIR